MGVKMICCELGDGGVKRGRKEMGTGRKKETS